MGVSCQPAVLYPTVLPPCCPAALLPCRPAVLPPCCPAALLSCCPAALPPYCPAALLSCRPIVPAVLPTCHPAVLLSYCPADRPPCCPANPTILHPTVLLSCRPAGQGQPLGTLFLLFPCDCRMRTREEACCWKGRVTESDLVATGSFLLNAGSATLGEAEAASQVCGTQLQSQEAGLETRIRQEFKPGILMWDARSLTCSAATLGVSGHVRILSNA